MDRLNVKHEIITGSDTTQIESENGIIEGDISMQTKLKSVQLKHKQYPRPVSQRLHVSEDLSDEDEADYSMSISRLRTSASAYLSQDLFDDEDESLSKMETLDEKHLAPSEQLAINKRIRHLPFTNFLSKFPELICLFIWIIFGISIWIDTLLFELTKPNVSQIADESDSTVDRYRALNAAKNAQQDYFAQEYEVKPQSQDFDTILLMFELLDQSYNASSEPGPFILNPDTVKFIIKYIKYI